MEDLILRIFEEEEKEDKDLPLIGDQQRKWGFEATLASKQARSSSVPFPFEPQGVWPLGRTRASTNHSLMHALRQEEKRGREHRRLFARFHFVSHAAIWGVEIERLHGRLPREEEGIGKREGGRSFMAIISCHSDMTHWEREREASLVTEPQVEYRVIKEFREAIIPALLYCGGVSCSFLSPSVAHLFSPTYSPHDALQAGRGIGSTASRWLSVGWGMKTMFTTTRVVFYTVLHNSERWRCNGSIESR